MDPRSDKLQHTAMFIKARRQYYSFAIVGLFFRACLDPVGFVSSTTTPEHVANGLPPQWQSHKDEAKIAGFYHVYTTGDYFKSVVNEQIQVMKDSGLLDLPLNIYYVTVGEGNAFDISATLPSPASEKFHKLAWHASTWEMLTLGYVYGYCKANPLDKVFYFHTKGAYHPGPENDLFRQDLGCITLTKRCVEALDHFDTCGMRVSPTPHMHYPGNFWWARCSYVKTLNHPRKHKDYEMAAEKSMGQIWQNAAPECFGSGRFFAETWVTSHPDLDAADCLGKFENTSYLNGYSNLPSASSVCKNIASVYRSETQPWCGVAAMNASGLLPSEIPDQLKWEISPKFVCGDAPIQLIARAKAWYPHANLHKLQHFLNRLKELAGH